MVHIGTTVFSKVKWIYKRIKSVQKYYAHQKGREGVFEFRYKMATGECGCPSQVKS